MRDVAVVGGGHNGLICAAYLALAGLDVEVLEANDSPGGCIWTEHLASGHRLELGAIDLAMVDDVVADLRLLEHGLELIPRRTQVGAGFGDGTRLLFDSDLESTIAGMVGVPSTDRAAYRDLAQLSGRLLAAFDALPGVPSFGEVVRLTEALSSGLDLTRLLVSSSESLVGARISDAYLASAITMYGAHSQLPPWLPGTGLFALLLPGAHGRSAYRARGGTGAFIDAVVSALTGCGGSVRTNARVSSIEHRGDAALLRLEDGEVVTAARVVSSLDVGRTAALVADVPKALGDSAAAVRSGALNVGELKIDLALSGPAIVTGDEADAGLWLLQERPDSLRIGFAEIIAGTLPTSPAMMWAAPSALDPTAAPESGGTMWISSFVPARLRGGSWNRALEEEAGDLALDGLAAITGTDVRPLVVDRRIIGPVGWQQRTGAAWGNPNHVDLTLDQMFGWRPPGLSGYRAGVPWLYLTGAGTFPGGGVSGIPGRNAARALLGDLGGRRRGEHRIRRELRGLWDAWSLYRTVRRRR